jgi:hypothetical protein
MEGKKMLHKDATSMRAGFRELSLGEIEFVSGGRDGITITGTTYKSITPEDLALVNETLGSPIIVIGNIGNAVDTIDHDEGYRNVNLLPILPNYEQFTEFLRDIINGILNKFGRELINPQDQAKLNQELSGKDQAFTIVEDGVRVTFTRDGTGYWDRNGDGAVDIKSRMGPTGFMEWDTGDGAGWRIPM